MSPIAPTSIAPITSHPTTHAPVTTGMSLQNASVYIIRECKYVFLQTLFLSIAPTTHAPETPPTGIPTSLSPVTTSPTSHAPITVSPTSHAPVTTAPSSHAPVTTSPTSHAPVTASPSSHAPGRLKWRGCFNEGYDRAHPLHSSLYLLLVTAAPVTAAPVSTSPTASPVTAVSLFSNLGSGVCLDNQGEVSMGY